jgi:hypothetical protein
MRLRSSAFLGDRSIKGGKVDHLHRLCAQHEWIVAKAMGVDLHCDRSRADVVEALGRIGFDTAIEQMSGDEVPRIFKSSPQGESAQRAVVGVARSPEIFLSGRTATRSANWRQRHRFVPHQGVRLQPLLQCRKIGKRFDR